MLSLARVLSVQSWFGYCLGCCTVRMLSEACEGGFGCSMLSIARMWVACMLLYQLQGANAV